MKIRFLLTEADNNINQYINNLKKTTMSRKMFVQILHKYPELAEFLGHKVQEKGLKLDHASIKKIFQDNPNYIRWIRINYPPNYSHSDLNLLTSDFKGLTPDIVRNNKIKRQFHIKIRPLDEVLITNYINGEEEQHGVVAFLDNDLWFTMYCIEDHSYYKIPYEWIVDSRRPDKVKNKFGREVPRLHFELPK